MGLISRVSSRTYSLAIFLTQNMALACCLMSSLTGLFSVLFGLFKSTDFFSTIGSIVLIYSFFTFMAYISKLFIVFYLNSNQDLRQKFGPYALVTGCTDGIGEAFVKVLAREYKMNLILVSRTKSKLDKLKQEITNENEDIKCFIIPVDFTDTSDANYQKIEQRIQGLDVRILINNVGHRYGHGEGPIVYDDAEPVDDIEKLIKVNLFAQTKLTNMFLKRWKKCENDNKRSLCINMSSFSAVFPMPYMSFYPATKQYNKFLIESLIREQKSQKDSCCTQKTTFQILEPYFVATRTHPIAKKPSFGVPSPENFVNNALRCVGHFEITSGMFFIDLYGAGIRMLHNNIYLSWLPDMMSKMKMKKFIAQKQK